MAEITAAMVKELREKTGAGIMDCKKALKEKDGILDDAVDFLREKGLAAASKKSGRIASEGLVGSYIHAGGKIGVIVEINCETDFVARTDAFQAFVKDICMQVAASNPLAVTRDDLPADDIEKEKHIFRLQALESGKPEKIVDKIVAGRIEKYYAENCLMEQKFVKNPDVTIEELVKEMIVKTGENVSIRRFTRYLLGEGLEKRNSDLAQEVADQLK